MRPEHGTFEAIFSLYRKKMTSQDASRRPPTLTGCHYKGASQKETTSAIIRSTLIINTPPTTTHPRRRKTKSMHWKNRSLKGLALLLCAFSGQNSAKAQPNIEPRQTPAEFSNPAKDNYLESLNQEIQELQDSLNSFKEQFTKNSRSISLDEAIELALKNNPTLQASIDQVQSSEWLLTASQQSWYPALSLNSDRIPSYGFNSTYSYGEQSSSQRSTSNFQTGLNAAFQWTFIDPQRQPNINTSYYQLSANKLLFYTTARDTISSVQIGYYNLQGSTENIGDFQDIVRALQQNYISIASKYKSGYANILQVEQIKSQLETELNNLITYYIEYSRNAAQLSAYIGLPTYTIIAPSKLLAKEKDWTQGLKQSINLGLSNSELIQQALAEADQNKWRGYYELNTYLPKFSLSLNSEASQDSSRESSWGTYGQQNTTQRGNTYGLLGFRWQLFNGGINYSNANSYFSLQRKSLENSREQSNAVVNNVRSNYALMFGRGKAIEVTEKAYRSAQEANEASTIRFNAGFDDVTTIVQTVQQLSRSSLERTRAVVEYNTAISNLYRYVAMWPPNTYPLVEELLSPRKTIIRKSALPVPTGKAPNNQ